MGNQENISFNLQKTNLKNPMQKWNEVSKGLLDRSEIPENLTREVPGE